MRIVINFTLIIFFMFSNVYADNYFGIYPNATLSDIKSIYPNATYDYIKPAWLQSNQLFISISGSGIKGTISVAFNKVNYEGLEREYNDLVIKEGAYTESNRRKILRTEVERYRAIPESDLWLVDEIRWTPPTEIKLTTFAMKYGKPDNEYIDENMNIMKIWNKYYSITAFVDDNDLIYTVIYKFNIGDYKCEPFWREGSVCNPKDYIEKENPSTNKNKRKRS